MASVHAKTHQSGNQCVILYTRCSVQKLVNPYPANVENMVSS